MKKDVSFEELREQEREARRGIIIAAAERVFAEKPFDQVSIRDIAREAGISHPLIYRYFPDQQALFVEAFLRGAGQLLQRIHSAENGGIEAITETYLRFLIDNDQYFRMMTHFMLDGSLGEEQIERLNDMERKLLDRLDSFFGGKGKMKDSRKLSHSFFAAMNGVLISFRNYPGRSRDDVVNHMLELGRIIASRFRQ
ncbi:MAG: TetR/AcrR family transcriptional regulator [Spirochaetes bacterium]|nr:TetR/AcrR family transcriptional regulator [Spirochaetota bacterium]